jgi:hypothetical protein
MKKIGSLLFPVLAIALMLGSAMAQNVGDSSVYFVTYYSNNVSAAPDETVRLINDGETGGNLWAAFYVFDDSQELQECCACVITPDGLLSESVQKNLTANPITGRVPKVGVIKVISSASNDPTNVKPTTGLRGWATHMQHNSAYWGTETTLADSNLSAGEQALLQNLCYYDALLSGQPCTCTPEDKNF